MIYARPAILASVKSCITTCSFFSTIRISLVSIRLLRQVNSLSCINCNCNRHEIHYDFSRSIFSRHPPRLSGIDVQRVFRVSTMTYQPINIIRTPCISFIDRQQSFSPQFIFKTWKRWKENFVCSLKKRGLPFRYPKLFVNYLFEKFRYSEFTARAKRNKRYFKIFRSFFFYQN